MKFSGIVLNQPFDEGLVSIVIIKLEAIYLRIICFQGAEPSLTQQIYLILL